MMYETTSTGFVIHLDRTIYARQAVMKAFYRFQHEYIVSYELRDKWLDVYLDKTSESKPNDETALREIFAELNFEMIHYDTARETSGLRELLVGRALYASCVDIGRGSTSASPGDEVKGNWEEDQARIFSSWSTES